MTLTYYFDDEPFEFEVYNIRNFIEEMLSDEDIIDIYIDEVYNKDSNERDLMYQEFGVKSQSEVKDMLYSETDNSWIIDSIADMAEDYIKDMYEDELIEFYKDDAITDYQDALETQSMYDEAEQYYWDTRL